MKFLIVLVIVYFYSATNAVAVAPAAKIAQSSKLALTPKDETETSHFSFRLRPFAFAQGIFGAEAFYQLPSGWFAGPTAHFFSGDNSVKATTLTNQEIGIKLGHLFYRDDHQRGFFILGSVDFENTTIGSYYSITKQTFNTQIQQYSESLFVGYQFRAILIGPKHWDLRLGLGAVYKPEVITYFKAIDGNIFPLGVRQRLDSSLEFTLGYEI